MNDTRPDETAFPSDSREAGTFKGLTKREYFAAMALQGMVNFDMGENYVVGEEVAKRATLQADQLINALNKYKIETPDTNADFKECLRLLRISFKQNKWEDYSAGTTYHQVEMFLKNMEGYQ
jgi:hypothetical protein